MEDQNNRGTPDEKIASEAKAWRQRDRIAIANRQDHKKQRAEYAARHKLRQVIDEAGART